MDSLNAEKARAMRSYNLFTGIARTLRVLELCLLLVFLSWILIRLPFALRISGDYLRKLSVFIASPLFVFLISNAIIATLLAKSRRFSSAADDGDSNAAATDLYDQFLKNASDRNSSSASKSESESSAPSSRFPEPETEVVYQDKEIVSDLKATTRPIQDRSKIETRRDSDSDAGLLDFQFPKVYRRSQSEKLQEETTKRTTHQKLRRSETEKKCMKMKNPPGNLYPQDNLSNEEFQRTIEAFIAKQMRFLREESLAIVIQNQS